MSETDTATQRRSALSRFLSAIERIGTVIATMLPYSVVFMLVWMFLLVFWLLVGIPIGPGAGLYLPG